MGRILLPPDFRAVRYLYGKLADLFGRKWVFVFSMVVFEIGSLLCGAAKDMSMLILGRAVAGIGGGGIFTIAFIIISDIAVIEDRPKYQGMVGGIYGLATIIGPLAGGAFSDHVSWRWCFYINLPLGLVAVPAVVWYLRLPSPPGTLVEKFKRIDILGTVLIFLIVAAVITPTQFGGSVWAWSSPQVIILYIVTAVLLAAFIYVERSLAAEPISRSVSAILGAGLAVGAAFVGAIYYISLFFQIVNGDSATAGGVKSIPLVFSHVGFSIAAGIIMSTTGRYKYAYFIGPVFMIAGIALVSSLNGGSLLVQQIFYLFIFGIGSGLIVQTSIAAAQISVDEEHVAIVTGLAQTTVPLGGAFGIAISGAMFNNIIASDVNNYPVLLNAIKQLQDKFYPVDATQVLALSGLLTDPTITFVTNGTEANANLISIFNGAFKLSYLSLIAYPCIILIMAFLITEYRPKEGEKREIAMAV
ncbi:MFS general substrate transporter [Rhizoclosmatium globosum]|uniref:MFS general substrate transporter n=1 Tax=Rhizoclosmatium globosum TaxID=329046 RepID=A0A1Y2C4M5_9FUNG|nr:MFS general substrate transporter [Rhizoclosmatium globosum]|eukprot:ORY41978.1 MFS general substrate transporter [Rhizoclosmatium globosum]